MPWPWVPYQGLPATPRLLARRTLPAGRFRCGAGAARRLVCVATPGLHEAMPLPEHANGEAVTAMRPVIGRMHGGKLSVSASRSVVHRYLAYAELLACRAMSWCGKRPARVGEPWADGQPAQRARGRARQGLRRPTMALGRHARTDRARPVSCASASTTLSAAAAADAASAPIRDDWAMAFCQAVRALHLGSGAHRAKTARSRCLGSAIGHRAARQRRCRGRRRSRWQGSRRPPSASWPGDKAAGSHTPASRHTSTRELCTRTRSGAGRGGPGALCTCHFHMPERARASLNKSAALMQGTCKYAHKCPSGGCECA